MTRINEAGNLILFEGIDAKANHLSIHVHSADPNLAYLNARARDGGKRSVTLDRETAYRLAITLLEWAGKPKSGRP